VKNSNFKTTANNLSTILISHLSTGTSCLRNRKTTNCETQRLKNLHMYWIQTQLHNKQRSYWELQYTLHRKDIWQHTCRTLTDLSYIVARNAVQATCTTSTKVPNSVFFNTVYWNGSITMCLQTLYNTKQCTLTQPLYYSRHLHRLHVSLINSRLQAYFYHLSHKMLCTLWDPIVFTS